MAYKTLNEYLDILGMTKADLGARLYIGQRTILRWANGQNHTPAAVLEWLDALSIDYDDSSLPRGWAPEPKVYVKG
jgi:transcriptional regulator with XRE-family HTH domain